MLLRIAHQRIHTTHRTLHARFYFYRNDAATASYHIIHLGTSTFVHILPIVQLVPLLRRRIFDKFQTRHHLCHMPLVNKIDGICHHHLLDAVVDVVIYSQDSKQHACIMDKIFHNPLVDFSPKRHPIGIRMIGRDD